MKKMLLFSLMFIFTFSACHRIHGNGSIKSETRNVPAFEGVTCDGSYEVQIKCQAEQSLTIETDENLLPLIRTEVHDRKLNIRTKGFLFPTDKIRVTISIPNINEFTSNGSSDGEINNINNNELDVDINGSGKLFLDGKTGDVKFSTSGSSKIDATSLIADDVKVRINGSGNIHVFAGSSLDVQINGSGTVKYKGDAKNVNQQINGSGKIIKE